MNLANDVVVEKKGRPQVMTEEKEILLALKNLQRELDLAHSNFEQATDPLLIDSWIYQIMSMHKRYQFYLGQCKEKGLNAGGY